MEIPDRFDNTLIVRRSISRTAAEVFAAFTEPVAMAHWMCPGSIEALVGEVDLRVGGAFRLAPRGEAKSRARGVYRIVEPPSRLAFTWVSDEMGNRDSLVTVEITEAGKGCCAITFTHEGFPLNSIVDYLNSYLLGLSTRTLFQEITFDAPPREVFEALLDSEKYAGFTGVPASIDRRGGAFRLYDGQVEGDLVDIELNRRIVQRWRQADWPKGLFSTVTIELESGDHGTRTSLKLQHAGIPIGRAEELNIGWHKYHWEKLSSWLALAADCAPTKNR